MEQHGQIQNVEQKMTDMSVIIYDNINLKTGKLNYIDKYGKYKVLTKSGNHFGKL